MSILYPIFPFSKKEKPKWIINSLPIESQDTCVVEDPTDSNELLIMGSNFNNLCYSYNIKSNSYRSLQSYPSKDFEISGHYVINCPINCCNADDIHDKDINGSYITNEEKKENSNRKCHHLLSIGGKDRHIAYYCIENDEWLVKGTCKFGSKYYNGYANNNTKKLKTSNGLRCQYIGYNKIILISDRNYCILYDLQSYRHIKNNYLNSAIQCKKYYGFLRHPLHFNSFIYFGNDSIDYSSNTPKLITNKNKKLFKQLNISCGIIQLKYSIKESKEEKEEETKTKDDKTIKYSLGSNKLFKEILRINSNWFVPKKSLDVTDRYAFGRNCFNRMGFVLIGIYVITFGGVININGRNGNYNYITNLIHIYDTVANEWITNDKIKLPYKISNCTAIYKNECIHIIGGTTIKHNMCKNHWIINVKDLLTEHQYVKMTFYQKCIKRDKGTYKEITLQLFVDNLLKKWNIEWKQNSKQLIQQYKIKKKEEKKKELISHANDSYFDQIYNYFC